MEIYSPRKNYNFSAVKNELKERNEVLEKAGKIPIIKAGSGIEVKEKPVEVMRRKLFERVRVFFDYQDVVT
jgi:hypothetical protein